MFESSITKLIQKGIVIASLLVSMLAMSGCEAANTLRQTVGDLIAPSDTATEQNVSVNESKNGITPVINEDTLGAYEDSSGVATGQKGNGGISVYNTNGDLIETEVSVINQTGAAQSASDIYAKDIVEQDGTYKYADSSWYAYSCLTEAQKQTYMEIYAVLVGAYSDVILSSIDSEEIDYVFGCVMLDHPEIFYVKGYSIGKYMLGEDVTKISISGTYTVELSDIEYKREEIEQYITNVIEKAPKSDDYEKIKYVYEYLINNNEYDESATNNQNILSVVENGRTVCQGYAKMTQLILNRMGIFCTLVSGTACGSGGMTSQAASNESWGAHVWNVVRCNGQYYNVDTTWGDAAFILKGIDDTATPVININYEYLLVNDNELVGNHRAEPIVPIPACISVVDNYYVREGLYFDGVDDTRLRTVFDNAYENGELIIYLKGSDFNAYNELFSYLIDEQKIFDFIYQDNVKYIEYPDRNLLLFYL